MKYVEICTYLQQLVRTELNEGDKIPSERALCQRFDVSRMTVRQAVDVLVNDGILIRKQGRGTYVAHQKLDLQLRITSFAEEMRMRGMVPATTLLEVATEPAPPSIAAALGLPDGAPTHYVRRLRFAGDAPMCVERAWMPANLLPGFCDPAPPDSLYDELRARGLGPTWGEDTIECLNFDRSLAHLLQVKPGAAGIVVTRRTFAENVPIQFAISYYRGDRYKMWVPIAQPRSPIQAPYVRGAVRRHHVE